MSSPQTSSHDPQFDWDSARLFPVQRTWTIEEYLDATDSTNNLIEFTDGRIEVLEMPTTSHQLILEFLHAALKSFVVDKRVGVVLFAALRLQVGETKFREPDVLFVGNDHRDLIQERYWTGADLVMEVVSNDAKSRERDLVSKRREYAAAGIAEYWIVDPMNKQITVLGLEGTEYKALGEFAPGQQAVSHLLEGFSVDVAATFQAGQWK